MRAAIGTGVAAQQHGGQQPHEIGQVVRMRGVALALDAIGQLGETRVVKHERNRRYEHNVGDGRVAIERLQT